MLSHLSKVRKKFGQTELSTDALHETEHVQNGVLGVDQVRGGVLRGVALLALASAHWQQHAAIQVSDLVSWCTMEKM